jgi:hypothetical protein
MKILCKVISNVLDDQNSTCSIPINTVAYIVQTCLLLHTPSENIINNPNGTLETNDSLISLNIHQNSDILLQLLELDSKLPPFMRNHLLHSLVLTYTIHILNQSPKPVTSNGDETAAGGDMFIWGLRALPYVLTGLTVNAPRTYGEFQDSDLAFIDAKGIY